jgi:4'-phosphopantetheinyl transferase EntD
VSHNHTADDIQVSSAKTIVIRKSERLEPKLAGVVIAFNMDMRRLVAIEAHEEKPVWPRNIADSWHLSHSSTPDTL